MATTSNFTCKYCARSFSKETTLSVHVCEQKKRWQEQSERGVQLGLQGYLKFYEYTQGSAKLKSWDDFATSPYYRAFVKWGRYCVDVRVIQPERFLEWLLKHNKKIDNWCSDRLYTEYLVTHVQKETVNDALARAIEYSIDWSEKTASPSHDCLRYGSANATCYAVTTGRISAWVIYNSESGQKFLSDLNAEQVAMIWPYIDSDIWQKKFADYPADQEYAKEILTQAGW
jgi:hypothetical protein